MRTLSRFALIGVIGGSAAACSSDASRLGDPFTNPFASLTGEPSATGSLPEGEAAPAPAIRTPRVRSEALAAPGPAMSPRPMAIGPAPTAPATRVASAEPTGSVAGMNPDAGRAMTPRASAPVPQPKLSFGKPADRAAERAAEARKAADAKREADARRLAEKQAAEEAAAERAAEARKAAERAADAKKLADRKVADARKAADAARAEAKTPVRPGQKTAEVKPAAKTTARTLDTKTAETKAPAKPDPKVEAARKAEAEARLAKAEAGKEAARKVAEARAAEAAAKEAAKQAARETAKQAAKEAAAKETKQAAAPAAPVKVASAEPTAPVAAAAPEASESFRWPAKGRVINGYGSSGNEGINIAVPEGTAVKAAEDGTVAYAGSDVKGYGKLVLVRHNNGYVSAYAHNGELDVRPGEKVKRGQTIAKSGATGNVTSPQLHFEIRKGATPVDPIPHLAGN